MPDAASGAVRAPEDILAFWFSERARSRWFTKEPAFDEEIRLGFGASAHAAAAGRLDGWKETPEGCLALVLLLDQVPRNIHRGTPLAFAADALARDAARHAVARGFDRQLPPERRWFLYMPFEHSEDPADQRQAVALFEAWAAAHAEGPLRELVAEQLSYARRHAEIVGRFGRFPHRNAILGRESTPEEIEFLKEPKSAF